MNDKASSRLVRGSLLALGLGTLLSACYVVPMNPDGSPAWQYLPPPPPGRTAGAPVPASPAMPPIASSYQARLYPMNEQAAQTGHLGASITDLHTGRGVLSMNLGGEYLSVFIPTSPMPMTSPRSSVRRCAGMARSTSW